MLKTERPSLAEYADSPPWQWWVGDLYIAGFLDEGAARRYGVLHGWIIPQTKTVSINEPR